MPAGLNALTGKAGFESEQDLMRLRAIEYTFEYPTGLDVGKIGEREERGGDVEKSQANVSEA